MNDLPGPKASAPVRILVVEPDQEVVQKLRRVLSQAGHIVQTERAANPALEALRTSPPDLVILSQTLPDADGLRLCREIKADPLFTDTFILLVSSSLAHEESLTKSLEAGADGSVSLPISDLEISAKVRAFTRLVQLRRGFQRQAEALERRRDEVDRLSREAAERAVELQAATAALVDSRRAALNLIDDTMEARRALETANEELRAEVAERRRVEHSLRKVSLATEQSPVSIVITDLKGDIEYVNPHFVRLTGYSLDEVTGKNPRILQSGETNPDTYKELWSAIAAGGVWEGEFHNRKKNGEAFWEHAVIAPVRDGSGAITNFVAVKEDITARKHTEQALRESEERHRLLAENATDVIWTMSPEGRFTYVSPSIERRRGYTVAEVMQQTFSESLTPASAALAEEQFQRIRRDVAAGLPFTPFNIELEQPCRDGSTVWTEVNVSGLFNDEGRFIGALGVSRDIGERRRAQEKLAAQLDELLRWQSAMLGRESRVQELKREVNDLARRLNLTPPYPSQVLK